MSDYVSFVKQRRCTDCCEDEKYIIDIFSYVQPECHDDGESHKQLFLYVTRAVENNRSAFLQVLSTKNDFLIISLVESTRVQLIDPNEKKSVGLRS